MLTAAMAIFMIGNLAAGFSKTIVQLIVLRGFAGAGGGVSCSFVPCKCMRRNGIGAILSISQIIMSDIVSLRDRYVHFTSLQTSPSSNHREEENTKA